MKIKSVALLSALICLLCSCSESPDSSSQTETLYPNSATNTDSEEASSAEITAQDKNYPDVSKGKKINKFSYIPIGYVDKENRYLLLKLSDNFSKTEYEIYDTLENVSVHSFVTEDDGQSGTADLRYSDDAFTFANFKYVEDKNFNICYSESYDIFGNMLFKYPESNGDIGISAFNYSLSDNKTYFVLTDNNKEGFYKSDKDGTNVTYISDVTPVDYFILDDEIVYYDVHYEYGKPENDACIFGIMDKEGNLQKQINIGRDSSNRVILYSIDKGSSVYRFTYSKSKQIGVMNRKGEVLIEPASLQLNRFTNGVSVFSVDTVINEKRTYLLGLIDTNGVIRIKPLYKRLTPVNGEITIFYDGERSVYGLINKNGQIVYETSETIVDYTDNLIVIEYEITNEKGKKIEKLGLIDTDGHTIVRPKFEDIYHFENGLAKVELKNGKVGYINHKGEYVIRPKREE